MTDRASRVRRSRFIGLLLGASVVIPFLALIVLNAADVRLGQGYFAYRYSPVRELRMTRALAAAPIAAFAALAIYFLAHGDRGRRRAGLLCLAAAMIIAPAWAWWAPPKPLAQQTFNLTSPASDGAFIMEADNVRSNTLSIAAYLRYFPQRIKATIDDMGGTRVLSNPPGMTVLAYTAMAFTGSVENPDWIERMLIDSEGIEPSDVVLPAATIRLGVTLCAIWALAGFAAYGLGRVFLPPAGAAVFAVIATFNPCTVLFVPGKDPGQLLTINLMLWAWFAGRKKSSFLLATIAGTLLVVGSIFGLIHVWVALVALIATFWDDRQKWRAILTRDVLAASVGASFVVLAAYLALGWNVPECLYASARRWSELQHHFAMNKAIWYAIGLPIFLLFVSSGLWTLIGLRLRRTNRRVNFGTRLAISTAAVMLFIYLVLGMTYELPRLWVAFLPSFTLGLAIDTPLLRFRGEHRRLWAVWILIVLAQIAFTAFHWTFFDSREAEYRLVSKRFYH